MNYLLTEDGIVTRTGRKLPPEQRREILRENAAKFTPQPPAPVHHQLCRYCFMTKGEKHEEPCQARYDPRAAHQKQVDGMEIPGWLVALGILAILVFLVGVLAVIQVSK